MKDIKENYEPVSVPFLQELKDLKAQRKYIRLHYFNDFHEYISTAALIKEFISKPSGEFLELNTGEEVRLDKIVRLEGKPAPGYDIQDFTCDC
ncbi:hypothetical protein [Adhaeribacter aquaticus]|uniref:hypothetical protein n=1 Tax=Adhaeribacter aquaticus TaxID=299567 RepID=UPI0003FD0100|nr:hypothetical protein [Adhaeribacter aquaticus]